MSNCSNQCQPGFIAGPNVSTKKSGCDLTPCPTFKTYVLPKNLGTDASDQPYAPKLGAWTNAIVVYEANGAEYLYDNQGVFTKIGGTGLGGGDVNSVNGEKGDVVLKQLIVSMNNQELARYNGGQIVSLNLPIPALGEVGQSNTGYITGDMVYQVQQALEALVSQETTNREGAINQVNSNIQNVTEQLNQTNQNVTQVQNSLQTAQENISSLQGESSSTEELLNQNVQRDTTVETTASTVTITKTTGNISTSSSETTQIPLPVASEEQAGVMNAATYQAVQNNSEYIDSILGGAVAISGIAASPSQQDLTNAWKQATTRDALINNASIFDVDNERIWYYYTNDSQWHSLTTAGGGSGGGVTVSIATNETAGIVKGSTADGQVAVEGDGTMSLNGYDKMNSAIQDMQSTIQTVNSSVTQNTSDIETANENITQNTQKIEANTQNITTNTNNISDLTGRVAANESNISNLNNTIGQIDTMLTRLNTGTGV